MIIAYFDCFSGISGDMILGALLDLGLDISRLEEELLKLPVNGYRIEAKRVVKKGVSGTKFNVILTEKNPHSHRHLPDIIKIIHQSGLDEDIKTRAEKIFMRLALAEARVHGTTPEKVHFHEVGALDSLIDIIGTTVALKILEIERVFASPLPLSRGFITTVHGLLPLPAPATSELLKGVPVFWINDDKELVTPTGAAILGCISEGFGNCPPMILERIGYGAGSYEREVPNMLRIFIGKPWSFST